jgi:NADP oxidoreductase coenzyme F420-dependent
MKPPNIKSVGIIGAGRIGQAMARIASRAGRPVVIANKEGPQSLASLVQQLGDGVSAGTVNEAAGADIVVLAVMSPDVPQAVGGLEWEGRILIDPTNDFDPDPSRMSGLPDRPASLGDRLATLTEIGYGFAKPRSGATGLAIFSKRPAARTTACVSKRYGIALPKAALGTKGECVAVSAIDRRASS